MTLLDDLPTSDTHLDDVPSSRKALVARALRSIEADVDIVWDRSLGSQVHWRPEGPLHRWVRYREAYSPSLLASLNIGRRVLDPFSGSGSIMIGAAQSERVSIGIDLNPFATFATKVKLTPLGKTELYSVARFAETVEALSETAEPWPTPELSIASKTFEPEILIAQQQTRRLIADRLGETPAGRFVLLAWIAVFERVGSYFKEGNGIKYRNKLRRPGTYANRIEGDWQRARFGEDQRAHYFRELRLQLQLMLDDSIVWRSGTWNQQRVINATAHEIGDLVPSGSQDSVIFSPPYANRFDYFESYKVELWFGGFVNKASDLLDLRKRSMRSHLGADLRAATSAFGDLEEFIGLMDTSTSAWRMGVPSLMRGYFDDLRAVLRQSAEALVPGGRCYVVVGNSAFSGVIFPVDVLAARMAQECGFSDSSIIATRHLSVSPQQRTTLTGLESYMRESVVIFER